jgi:hypothetical protein
VHPRSAHPERFKGKHPTPPALPEIVGINLPQPQPTETTHDLTTTPALHTNFLTKCLKVIDTFRYHLVIPRGFRVQGQPPRDSDLLV